MKLIKTHLGSKKFLWVTFNRRYWRDTEFKRYADYKYGNCYSMMFLGFWVMFCGSL